MPNDPSAPSIEEKGTEVLYWLLMGAGVANLSVYEGTSASLLAAYLQATPPPNIITK